MTDLREALDDYLRLRRSLGHQMAEAAWLLPDFVGFMEDRGQTTVSSCPLTALGVCEANGCPALTPGSGDLLAVRA